MIFFLSLLLASWFKYEISVFPTRINYQIYEDYHQLVSSSLKLKDFLSYSILKTTSSKASFLLFILLPLNSILFQTMDIPLIIIGFILIYLSLLDYLYYLTDIRYIVIIFLCSLTQLLFFETLIYEHLFSLFATSLFFSIFTPLVNTILKKESIGTGDILLFISLSSLFPLDKMVLLIFLAALFGLIFIAIAFVITQRKLTRLPFIPFISLSTFTLFIGRILS